MKWTPFAGAFIILVAFPHYIYALTGRTCTRRKSSAQTYTAYQQLRQSQRYTVGCGWFKWKRCARYRDVYVSQGVNRVRTIYHTETICCRGWRVDSTGTNCNIHNMNPSVVSCPVNKLVRATSKITRITWNKPQFKEPFGYPLNVKSTYGGEFARLPWGDTRVEYMATSQNNNKQVKCAFTITILPPIPKPVIKDYTDGETVNVTEHERLVLECRAEYGRPPPNLLWFRNNVPISNGTRYTKTASDYADYKHAVNTLMLNPTRIDDGSTYKCQTIPDIQKYMVVLNVAYEVIPVATFCPENKSVESSRRYNSVSWEQPTFEDPRWNETVDVVGSLGNVTEKVFGWGEHDVIYTGTNRRNKLSAFCNFTISLWPPECHQNELIPQDGAVACGYWSGTHTHVCKPFCPDTYDVTWFGRHPHLYVCGADGQWWPREQIFNCSDSSQPFVGHTLLKRGQYFATNCSTSLPNIKSSFLKSIKSSPFESECSGSTCDDNVLLTVHCY